jgi:hypothetical protein
LHSLRLPYKDAQQLCSWGEDTLAQLISTIWHGVLETQVTLGSWGRAKGKAEQEKANNSQKMSVDM